MSNQHASAPQRSPAVTASTTVRTTSELLGQSYRMTVTYQAETQTFRRRAKLFSELLRDLGELIISAGAEEAGAPPVAGHRSLRVGRS